MTSTPWREKWFVLQVEALEAGTVQPCAWDLRVRTVPLSKAARHSCSVKPPPRDASAMAGSQKADWISSSATDELCDLRTFPVLSGRNICKLKGLSKMIKKVPLSY